MNNIETSFIIKNDYNEEGFETSDIKPAGESDSDDCVKLCTKRRNVAGKKANNEEISSYPKYPTIGYSGRKRVGRQLDKAEYELASTTDYEPDLISTHETNPSTPA